MRNFFASVGTILFIYAVSFEAITGQFDGESMDEDVEALVNVMENMRAERNRYPEFEEAIWDDPRESEKEIDQMAEEKEKNSFPNIGDGQPGSEAEVIKNLKHSANKIEKKSPEVVPFAAPLVQQNPIYRNSRAGQALSDASKMQLIVLGSALCALATVGLVVGATLMYKRKQNLLASEESGNPIGELKGQSTGGQGDKKLAQSAQMYHYQHQKQQMIALEKASNEIRPDGSDEESEPENEEGDYTVYECPGLAPTGELEVRNPLFQGDENLLLMDNDDEKAEDSANK